MQVYGIIVRLDMFEGTVSIVRVILTGGGTGGHIYPALSMLEAIKEKYPDSTFLYIGTPNGLEANIVSNYGVDFKTVKVSGIKRSFSFENFKTLYHFVTSISVAKKYIKEFKPDLVIGTGGYVCGPVVYAASKLKIKTIIHEQNSYPGITNKFLARYVDRILICFDEAKKYFPNEKTFLTGNPRASEVVKTLKLGKTSLSLNPHKKTILISGGSRGAKPLNEAVKSIIPLIEKSDFQVVFVTGAVHYDGICEDIKALNNLKNVIIKPFIEEMPKYLTTVDLFVGRAGASTIAEITALGVASILIPSPYVAENHQEFNALSVVKPGGGIMILEKDLTGEYLLEIITNLFSDEQKLTSMKLNAKEQGIPDATCRILSIIDTLVN